MKISGKILSIALVLSIAACEGNSGDPITGNGTQTENPSDQPDTPSTGDKERPVVESRFVRHICVMEFTGQWCAQCPDGYNTMNFIISRNYPDVAHIIALHDNSSGKDEFALDVQNDIAQEYKISSYPYCLVDLRASMLATDSSELRSALDASAEDYTPYCGVAVSSEYNAENQTARITVKLHSEYTSQYRIALWIIEDNIVASQNVNGIYRDEYTHHHVARSLASTSWKGDSIGTVEAGSEGTKTYSVPADPAWNIDNVTVCAIAIDTDGYVNNMAECAFVDGNTDYDYKQ